MEPITRPILTVCAEGGSLRLLATTDALPRFSVRLNDQSLTFIGEGAEITHESGLMSWNDAFTAMGRYPWHKMSPTQVDPEYAGRIWSRVKSRADEMDPDKLMDWRELCGKVETHNVVTAILGRRDGAIKWDATWNLLAWLFDPDQGHGLGATLLSRFATEVFDQPFDLCELRTEVNLGPEEGGTDKWPDLVLWFPSEKGATHVVVMDDVDVRSPGSTRKLLNLAAYGRVAQAKHPAATVRVVVITNAADAAGIAKVSGVLEQRIGTEAPWKLIPLQTIGHWVAAAMDATSPDPKMEAFLSDMVEWSGADKHW